MHANNMHKICMQLLKHYLYATLGRTKTLKWDASARGQLLR